MKRHIAVAMLAGLAIMGSASAQLTILAPPASEPKSDATTVEKPKAPTKPVVPGTKPATAKTTTGNGTPFAPELQTMSPEARAFAMSKLSAMTPALRVRAATKVAGKAIALNEIPQSWIATAGNPSTPYLWLGGKSVNLVTGPNIEPMFQVAGGNTLEQGVWVQFNAEAGIRYMLVCDLTGPGRWDLVVDSKSRVPMMTETETRGVALIAARQAAGYQRILLVVARPLQTGPASSVFEGLRRCEVTAIRA